MKIYISLGMIAIGCLSILGTYLRSSRKRSLFIEKQSFIGAFLFGLGGRKALINFNYFGAALVVLWGIGTLFLELFF